MKKIILALAVAAVATMTLVGYASAGVERYQATTTTTTTTKTAATFTVTQPAGAEGQWDNLWTHDYTVTINPDGTFTGTGIQTGQDQLGSKVFAETISGKFAEDSVSLTATRSDGLVYELVDAQFGGPIAIAKLNVVVPWKIEMKVTEPDFTTTTDTTTTTTNYKNHGDYVSQTGGGAEAAHSPIGKPIKASK